MRSVAMIISKAIKEGKWIDIEYLNSNGEITNYWCSVTGVLIKQKKLEVNMFNAFKSNDIIFTTISFESIKSAQIIEFSHYTVDDKLIHKLENARCDWLKYDNFNNNILMYLAECNKLDNDPFQKDYALVEGIDYRVLRKNKKYKLNDEQIKKIVRDIYHLDINNKDNSFCNLALNRLSINVNKKLYVVAYQNVCFNPLDKSLYIVGDCIINKSFLIDKKKHSLSAYLSIGVEDFVENFESNIEEYTDMIMENLRSGEVIDQDPKLMILEKEIVLDLYPTYESIESKHDNNELSVPLKCFFGNNSSRYNGKKDPIIVLKSKKTNIDQIRVVYNAMKNPVTYVQGPPGTGKTTTIENVILSSFLNNKTCLIVSNNNKPIDGIYDKLKFKYKGHDVPFPVLRLGNREETLKAIDRIKELYQMIDDSIVIKNELLEQIKEETSGKYGELKELLKEYEERNLIIENKKLLERFDDKIRNKKANKKILNRLNIEIENFNSKLDSMVEVTNDEVIKYTVAAEENYKYKQYLYYESYRYILKLKRPMYKELIDILYIENDDKRVSEFNRYLKDQSNAKKFINVFPFIITTNISSSKIGNPVPIFDLCIMDEAGQCNIATSLVPITRANNLLLVGDENQLQPVVVLEDNLNKDLINKYGISPEYDYCNNSIIKLMQTKDRISTSILLRYHYRCPKKIIEFSNLRYYNSKLNIVTEDNSDCMELIDVKNDKPYRNRNAYYSEAKAVVDYIKSSGYTDIGVITPFRNQADLLNSLLKKEGLENVSVGTVHQLQGGEKELIILSPAIAIKSATRTYKWLANNRELINVGASRATKKFVVVTDKEAIEKHAKDCEDDIKSLVDYVASSGTVNVIASDDKASGVNYSNDSQYEEMLFETLSHFCSVYKNFYVDTQIKVSDLFKDSEDELIKNNKDVFDFVFYKKNFSGKKEPVLVIELNGGEHIFSAARRASDKRKYDICKANNIEIFFLSNEYAKSYDFLSKLIISINKQDDQLSLFE